MGTQSVNKLNNYSITKILNMKLTTIRHFLLGCMLTAALASCGGNESGNSSTDDSTATTGTSDTGNNVGDAMKSGVDTLADKINSIFANSSNPDSSFVLNAGTQNEDEMKLLQAGLTKGTSAELKAHAKMMLADHKKMGQEVKAYASKKKYSTMSPSDSKAADELKDINSHTVGADWDKAWTDKMVNGHEKTIRLFEKGQTSVKDSTLSGMITKTLPTLHSHLTMVQGLQNSLK